MNAALDGLTPWPEELAETYCKGGCWQKQNLASWFTEKVSNKENIVLSGLGIDGKPQDLTGKELHLCVQALAQGLAKLNIQPSEKVVLQMGNTNSFVITLFALFELGAIPVMALPGHRYREIEHFLNLTKARTWIAGDNEENSPIPDLAVKLKEGVPSLQNIILDKQDTGPFHSLGSLLENNEILESTNLGHAADPAGIAVLLCSGGTTGLPKLIPRTHRDYLFNAKASAEVCELDEKDGYLVALPAGHNFPLACPGILGAFEQGARVVMCPSPSPDIAYQWITDTNATVTALVPPLVRVWLQNAELGFETPSTLRLLQVGGSRLDADLAQRIPNELGCKLQQVFGMAEGLLNFTRSKDPDLLVQKTQGRPLSELDEIRIVDNQGQDVPSGQRGELWTRGPYTLRGYYKDQKANDSSFSADGYYKSGDLVRRLSSGHLIVEGRIKEVIRRGAETIPAESLETHLSLHSEIKAAAVIGLPCERLGQQVCAVLVNQKETGPTLTLNEVRHFLIEEGVAHFMLPDSIEYVPELPFTAVGKVAYQQLISTFSNPSPKTTH
ncbi:(2,3-dihydroxybenzoyl)adenylate synthase [Marinomonas transparens]|uniref:AMP-binding protein n=1 Tax=Marinomonas transparens TaxID=2795388 RepID=A0A934JLJ7_9GAMM|nr:AMP-binding protein [Marinomonas transparens]MBJ7536593.1 AMP-binding protein [Marinomonas transparens]